MENVNKSFDPDPNKLYRIVAWMVLGTMVFGMWGLWLYECRLHPGSTPDVFNVIYHSSQLLIGHGVHLEEEIPWQLHVGRILGVVFIFSVGLTAFTLFFRQELLLFSLSYKRRNDHVVICGLGNLGLRLAKSAHQKGKLVVAIEKKEENSSIEQARKSGVLVFEGDATETSMLRKARAGSAGFVVACCAEDDTNVAIASRIGNLPELSKRKSPLVCRLLLKSSHLKEVLNNRFWNDVRNLTANYQVNFRDLDYCTAVARQCLNRFPLDFKPVKKDTAEKIHLVVMGFGNMGEQILLQAARQGHYANAIEYESRLKITLVDIDIDLKYNDFQRRYDKIDTICDVGTIHSLDYNEVLIKKDELMTFIFCFEKENVADDHRNMEEAINFLNNHPNETIQILVFQSTNAGLAALFPTEPANDNSFPKLGSFGMIEDIYTWDIIIHETQDMMAKEFHENYLITTGKGKTSVNRQKSDEWENQSEGMRESNRQVTDHLSIKLRAIGCHYLKMNKALKQVEKINDEDILVLAQMEHKRYCVERWLDGWEYAKTSDKSKKLNSTLICWDDLDPEEKIKDIEQVKNIIPMLNSFGFGVYKE